MSAGFAFALNEISLVLFTTLAPSGTVAFVLMAIPLLRGSLDLSVRVRLSKLLCVPLVVTMVGLIASATHLGNPDNALYVIAGIGRSPLSSEVAAAVAFLALAGVYWLSTFSQRFSLAAQRIWLAACAVAAIVFVSAVAFAYGYKTIATWSLWQVPVALWLNALVGGPLLALAGLRASQVGLTETQEKALAVVSGAALIANIAVYVSQGIALASVSNAFGSALELVPLFGAAVVAFSVLCAAGIILVVLPERVGASPLRWRHRLAVSAAACALAFVGIFLMRFAFYMTHMTVGL